MRPHVAEIKQFIFQLFFHPINWITLHVNKFRPASGHLARTFHPRNAEHA